MSLKQTLGTVCLCGLISFSASAYPRLLEWKNNPLIVFEGDKNVVLKKNQELKSPFFAITSRLDELRLELNVSNELALSKNSKIQIYEVFEDIQQEHTIFLIDGTVRIKNLKAHAKENKLNRLRTPFFDLTLPPQSDVIVQLNMKEPSVDIMFVKGAWDVEFFAYEKKLHLNAGQRVVFKGLLNAEGDQIRYDYLLDDKKIPKGELGSIQKFDVHKYEKEKTLADVDLLKKEKLEKKKSQQEIKKKKDHHASFLCKDPYGQLNQCAWKIEKEKCYRTRCNVSGVWGDKTERPVTDICTNDFLVGSCDY